MLVVYIIVILRCHSNDLFVFIEMYSCRDTSFHLEHCQMGLHGSKGYCIGRDKYVHGVRRFLRRWEQITFEGGKAPLPPTNEAIDFFSFLLSQDYIQQ